MSEPASRYEAIRYEQADGVATITLNRPDVHNAMNQAMRRELLEVFTRLRTDDSVRAVVVMGGGDKAFSAGADIREFLEPPVPTQFREARRRIDFRRDMERCPQPIIAAIRGYAFGGQGLPVSLEQCLARRGPTRCLERRHGRADFRNAGVVAVVRTDRLQHAHDPARLGTLCRQMPPEQGRAGAGVIGDAQGRFGESQAMRLVTLPPRRPLGLETGNGLAEIVQPRQRGDMPGKNGLRQAELRGEAFVRGWRLAFQKRLGDSRHVQHVRQQAMPSRLAALGPERATAGRQFGKACRGHS